MTEVSVRGILFDMDGVLVRSEGSIERAWTAWALRNGMPPSALVSLVHGRRSIDSVRAIRPDLDPEVENAFIENLEVTDNRGLIVSPGVLDLLQALPAARWTIVTSASKRLAAARLAAGGVPMPEKFVTGDDVENGKPDPAAYARGAEVLGLETSACLVIEDAPAGVASGKAAGCKVLAVADRAQWSALQAADYRVESLAQVKVEIVGPEITLSF
jgi:mannitol-1-/sugar-/sorbitol-6-phosphatase